jgi:signal transduction histidine kinase
MGNTATSLLGPWFRRHPCLAVASGVLLIGGVSLLQFTTGADGEPVGILYALPVALLALAFGLRAGAIAALSCIAVLLAWVGLTDAWLGPLGWFARMFPLLLLGVLIGHASDVQRQAEVIATRLAISQIRQRNAAEINDTIVQNLVALKWMLERSGAEDGIAALDDAIGAGQALVRDLLCGLDDPRRSAIAPPQPPRVPALLAPPRESRHH